MISTCVLSLLASATVFRGVTFLEKPIVLTPEDSGRVFVGEPGAVVSGGVRLGPWTDLGGGVWEAEAPRTADGRPMFFDQLWINERRAPNARLPNEGYLSAGSLNFVVQTNAEGVVSCRETVTFTNAVADALAAVPVTDLPFVQAGIIHKWSYAKRVPVAFAAAERKVTFVSDFCPTGWSRWGKNTLFSFQNVRSAFDASGEWFLDMTAGKVRYRPLPGETRETLVAYAPRHGLSKLVEFRGDPEHGRFVTNVTFRNVTFAHASFTSAPGESGPHQINQLQAACYSDGAIEMTGARNCAFENCRIVHTGNYGVRMVDGCVSNRIVNCTLEDLGAGGVWLGEHGCGDAGFSRPVERKILRPTVPTAVAFNLVSNCTIRAAGRYNPEGTGVAMTHCSDSKVVHCDIHDIYYTGVSVGYIWGFKGSVSQRNEIAFNRIYDLGKRTMSDMGGVYTLGTSFGTTVHDNVIHDVHSFAYGGWALYADEGSEGIVMERNLCWNTTDGGFHQHYGVGCIIRNNIFAWNRERGAVRTRRAVVDDIPCTLHFVNNIILVREGPLCGNDVTNVPGVWANNLWWDTHGEAAARFGKGDWTAWQASGHETSGKFADPHFVDAERFDFRLRADSPAFALGFKAWDYAAAGVK